MNKDSFCDCELRRASSEDGANDGVRITDPGLGVAFVAEQHFLRHDRDAIN